MKGREDRVKLRRLQERDLDTVLEIERESFPHPWRKKMFEEELRNPLSLCFGAESDGRLVGFLFSWSIFEDLHINNIAVLPRYRRRGIGRRLLQEAMERARVLGARNVLLEVRRSNAAAARFYERLGFREVGVRKGYYSDTGEDARLLFRKIQPVSGF
ncbi:MAG: ribosomal-protein-alanine N-acetyltransferase [Candidatus Hydrogenedentota bacterium]|nr:MAG: ribosomal-protein-alanine N-acetyltransferase [Candidatus Hydrogenedentota bacterium]